MRENEVWVASKPHERDKLHAGVRVGRDRVLSLWTELPSDMLGAILDSQDLAGRITVLLRLAADLGLSASDEVVLSVGLQGLSFASEGQVADLGKRSSTSIGLRQAEDFARVEPRDAVPFAALAQAAEEVARELATRLVLRFREVCR